jgi:gas vesicle protein
MAFTQDEIQAFNTILEQKLLQHRLELERLFDQRLHTFHHELEQRLVLMQQELHHALTQKLNEQQHKIKESVTQGLETAPPRLAQTIGHEVSLRLQQHQENAATLIENTLAAQLLAVEQLLNQHLAPSFAEPSSLSLQETNSDFEALEVQTEIPWEDFIAVIGRALDERLVSLDMSLQSTCKNIEHRILTRLRELRNELMAHKPTLPYEANTTNMQELFTSIEHLEHIIESMQVAMTTNHSLLSNRLYHHQHLPLERAHASRQSETSEQATPPTTGQLSFPKES